jgi:putative MFS transporter
MGTVSVTSDVAARLDRLPVSRVHYRLLFIHGFGWLFDAMDVGLITFVLAVIGQEWGLSSTVIGFIGSAGLAGMFVGAAVSGAIADRLGRKAVFQFTLLLFSVGTLLCAIAWDVASMMVFRFVVGVGLGGELPVVASLLSEFVPGTRRGRFIVWLESFWAFGWLAAALIAFLLIPSYGWRIAFVIGALPALYVWVVRRGLPESPRWLESRGRHQESLEIVRAMEVETTKRTGKSLPVPASSPAAPSMMALKPQFKELWSPKYRVRTITLWILWFGLVFGYYGIFVWLPSLLVQAGYSLVSSFGFVVVITLFQIPGYFSAAYLIERIGRKGVIVSYLFISAMAATLFGGSTSSFNILFWASTMSFFNLGAWGAVYAYTPELYPTRIRGSGAGSATAFGRLGGVLAPALVGLLLPSLGRSGVLTLNAGLLMLAAVTVGLLGEETKGRSLEALSD